MRLFRIIRRRVKKRRKVSKKVALEYKALNPIARALVTERLWHFNQHYQHKYNKIFIRNSRTRWGSCSSRANLGFNYRAAKLPPDLLDYLVVHELCHLKEMNHSKNFWALVEQTIPDWKERRKKLQKIHLS
jgi:predicted metal-dependent hydrolase